MKTNKTPAHALGNERGFTLLEAIVAMAVLAFGVLTVCMMQSAALRDSTAAYNRTEANNVAVALVEALQQLPWEDDIVSGSGPLAPTGNGTTTLPKEGRKTTTLKGDLNDRDDAHFCEPNQDGECGRTKLAALLKPAITVHADGMVTDRAGIPFELRWAVQDVEVEDEDTREANVTDKIIRVHMEWDTPAGKNHLEYTTNKPMSDK